jgi:arsenite-transporting ATPase
MVIDEARRTFTYLSLFGYGVDGVVINRVLPDEVSDPYFSRWHTIQKSHLDTIDEAFADVPRLRLRLFDDEMVGLDRLRTMASELYGDSHPVQDFHAHSPFRVIQQNDEVILEMEVPFAEKGSLDVYRQGTELFLQVGPYRRSFVLPDTLQRRAVVGAKLDDGILAVRFGKT